MVADDEQQDKRKISLQLSAELVARLDSLKGELGCRSRGALVERLLHNLLDGEDSEDDQQISTPSSLEGSAVPSGAALVRLEASSGNSFDESSALVLVGGEADNESPISARRNDPVHEESGNDTAAASGGSRPSSRGINLPGFVQRRTDQLRRSLNPRNGESAQHVEPLPPVPSARLDRALERVHDHWLELYGTDANETVLEAAMLWLAQDLWPQSDQSEGRPFTWSLATEVMRNLTPSWPAAPATFERVMVMAGVLEDPFSTSTLDVRIPTLIRRFVHRFRRRRNGTSFQTLEHTMTVHGALRLLQLPTDPGQRFTLPQIREVYRQMALAQHPDAGGSEDAMRRLNEAYQLLKELYRHS